MSWTKALGWLVPVLALAMLALMLVPAEVWKAPETDASHSGFDPNLVFASPGSTGRVDVSRSEIDISAPPIAQPTVNLATTLLPDLRASVTVTLLDNTNAQEPFRIGIWSPWTSSGYFLVFGSGPDNPIKAELLNHGSPSTTLVNAVAAFSSVVGHYQLNVPYTLSFAVDRTGGSIEAFIAGLGSERIATTIRRGESDLFQNVQLSLTASVNAGQGTSHVVLRDFSLALPHQRWWAVKVDDPVERVLVLALAALGLVALALAVIGAYVRGQIARPRFIVKVRLPAALLTGAAVVVYVAGNAALFPLGVHPFDGHLEELYAYVANTYGPGQLYYLPNAVSMARFLGGVPYIESAFPYGPVFGYLYAAIGWAGGALFGAGAALPPGDVRLMYLIKAVNVAFGLADAALIYLIVLRLNVARRWALIAAALFLFNPAVWFSMSIWGQTHVISLFLVLAAVLLAEMRLAFWAWLALAAALMTRPQMIVFGLLLGIVFLRLFSPRENLRAVSLTIVVVFVALIPFTLATSPSLPVDVTLNNFRIQQGGGNQAQLSTVSQDAYSVWPLVTYALHGTSGISRAFTPSSTNVVGNLTYQQLGLILTLLALLVVAGLLAVRRRSTLETGGYLPLAALGICSFLMLLTGVVATHFLLALPFLLLCRRWMGGIAYFYVAAIWTVTTLVPMYGDMGGVISAAAYPLLAPSTNAITRAVVALYQWDRFITVSIVANICALVWLAWLTLRRPTPSSFSA